MTPDKNIAQRVCAFVFDMDGTITDNMHFHTKAWLQVIDELGLPTEDARTWEHRSSGMPNRTILLDLLKLPLDEAAVKYWVERKEQLYREVAEGKITGMPGFRTFLDASKERGIRVALATGAGPENIAFNLKALNLVDQFDAVLGAADIARGKPNPDIFLAAAARVGATPDDSVVFEDAPMGLEAARRAGMRAVLLKGMLTEAQIAAYPNIVRVIGDFQNLDPILLLQP
jgi:beta-phosphoglucomutase family hydrolase